LERDGSRCATIYEELYKLYEPQPADNPMVQHQLQDRDRLLGELKNNLLKAQIA